MAKETVLIIEDEAHIAELLKFNLEAESYRVLHAGEGTEGLELARSKKIDLLILDIMLPGMDGLEICKTLRQQDKTANLPIIMLTAKGEEADKVVGLELGADDYVLKPFSPREVLARVKAILRRSSGPALPNRIQIGSLEVDNDRHQVKLSNKAVQLTSKEYSLLLALVEAKGRLLSREYLLEQVWGYASGSNIETRTIDMHIGQLRKKLASESSRLVTVKNAGYRFEHE